MTLCESPETLCESPSPPSVACQDRLVSQAHCVSGSCNSVSQPWEPQLRQTGRCHQPLCDAHSLFQANREPELRL